VGACKHCACRQTCENPPNQRLCPPAARVHAQAIFNLIGDNIGLHIMCVTQVRTLGAPPGRFQARDAACKSVSGPGTSCLAPLQHVSLRHPPPLPGDLRDPSRSCVREPHHSHT